MPSDSAGCGSASVTPPVTGRLLCRARGTHLGLLAGIWGQGLGPSHGLPRHEGQPQIVLCEAGRARGVQERTTVCSHRAPSVDRAQLDELRGAVTRLRRDPCPPPDRSGPGRASRGRADPRDQARSPGWSQRDRRQAPASGGCYRQVRGPEGENGLGRLLPPAASPPAQASRGRPGWPPLHSSRGSFQPTAQQRSLRPGAGPPPGPTAGLGSTAGRRGQVRR